MLNYMLQQDMERPKVPNGVEIIKSNSNMKPGKDMFTIEGYRPIALLPVLLKLFYSVIKNKLEQFFEEKNFFPTNTIGFRKGKSTKDIFFNLNNNIYNNKRKKLKQVLISIDFSKAFDKVNINQLIQILKKFKADHNIIKWLKQFLNNRKIIFGTDDQIEIYTSAGLPQGSCISPLLFNIYTIKLHDIETACVKVFQFADGFNLLITGKNQTELKKEMKTALNKFLK